MANNVQSHLQIVGSKLGTMLRFILIKTKKMLVATILDLYTVIYAKKLYIPQLHACFNSQPLQLNLGWTCS